MLSMFLPGGQQGLYFIQVDTGDNFPSEAPEHQLSASFTHFASLIGGQVVISFHLVSEVDAILVLTEIAVDPILYDIPATGRIRGDKPLAHAGAFQQAERHAFTVGGQHYSRCGSDMRANVVGLAEMFDQPLLGPLSKFFRADAAAIAVVQ